MNKSEKEQDDQTKFTMDAARMVMHQIASPLVSIRSHISNILSGRVPEDVMQQRIRAIDEMVQFALRELENFKIISEIDRLNPRIERINIQDFLMERKAIFQRMATSKDLEIIIQNEILSGELETDYSILSLAVDNLLDNAIKYSYHSQKPDKNGSEIIIRSWLQDDKFKLSITNKGLLISPDEIENVFSKFYRGSNATRFSGSGSGIGLYITQKCIESMGGKIDLFSRDHETTFTVTLTLNASTI